MNRRQLLQKTPLLLTPLLFNHISKADDITQTQIYQYIRNKYLQFCREHHLSPYQPSDVRLLFAPTGIMFIFGKNTNYCLYFNDQEMIDYNCSTNQFRSVVEEFRKTYLSSLV